jgi:lipoate-protein ligase A
MMHGEYKPPGGKLVVADFDVRDGLLVDVQITGDFFLYPEEALAVIAMTLIGMPADAADMADRIAAALPLGTEMLGFSPEAIAEAVRRGLAG